MRNNPEDIELRSEEVQEILGTPPGWMARWGTTLVFITFVVLAWASYYIKYPDIVKAEVEVTRTNPIRTLYSHEAGMIIDDIIVGNNDSVGVGQLLLVFESNDNASYSDVLILYDKIINLGSVSDSVLARISLPDDLRLGEGDLSNAFYDFKNSQINYGFALDPNTQSDRSTRRRITDLRGNLNEQEKLKYKLAKEIDAANADYQRNKRRYDDGKIAYPTLNTARTKVITLERQMQAVISNIKATNFYIQSFEKETQTAIQNRAESLKEAVAEMRSRYDLLVSNVEGWCEKYMVTAPTNGTVQYSQKNLRERMVITTANSPIFIVIPPDNSETIGKGYLRLEGSGKVRANQRVVVELNSYPSHDFGVLVGRVKWKGRAPIEIENERKIYYEVSFPEGLRTSAGTVLEETPNTLLAGEAKIITENKSLIDWVVQGFRSNNVQ